MSSTSVSVCSSAGLKSVPSPLSLIFCQDRRFFLRWREGKKRPPKRSVFNKVHVWLGLKRVCFICQLAQGTLLMNNCFVQSKKYKLQECLGGDFEAPRQGIDVSEMSERPAPITFSLIVIGTIKWIAVIRSILFFKHCFVVVVVVLAALYTISHLLLLKHSHITNSKLFKMQNTFSGY